jgi:hypothetical protein
MTIGGYREGIGVIFRPFWFIFLLNRIIFERVGGYHFFCRKVGGPGGHYDDDQSSNLDAIKKVYTSRLRTQPGQLIQWYRIKIQVRPTVSSMIKQELKFVFPGIRQSKASAWASLQ